MPKDIRGLEVISTHKTDCVVEIGRLTYKSSGVCVYLPKSVCSSLGLDPDQDKSLIIVSFNDNSFILIKDKEVIKILRPKILDSRKLLAQDKLLVKTVNP